jgi:hypothetical protein
MDCRRLSRDHRVWRSLMLKACRRTCIAWSMIWSLPRRGNQAWTRDRSILLRMACRVSQVLVSPHSLKLTLDLHHAMRHLQALSASFRVSTAPHFHHNQVSWGPSLLHDLELQVMCHQCSHLDCHNQPTRPLRKEAPGMVTPCGRMKVRQVFQPQLPHGYKTSVRPSNIPQRQSIRPPL